MKWWGRRRRDKEIAPDEIFLDAMSSPDFDRARFEGRLEKPLSRETFYSLAAVLAIAFLVLVVRAWNLQIVNGSLFAAASANNVLENRILFAPRGVITDMHRAVLAENAEGDGGGIARRYSVPSLGHVIGYVSYPKKDKYGKYYSTQVSGVAGLEAEFDEYLGGENGQLLTETDALGNIRSEGLIVPAKQGQTLQLTIDSRLQTLLAETISEIAEENGFIAGSGIVMDVHTGAVRALVSYPIYDPEVMSAGSPKEIIDGYARNPGKPFLDHAIQGVYTPGSVVKPFIAAGALTDGLITPNTVITDPGSISLPDPYNPGKKFIYNSWKNLGPLDLRSAIAWSSDVYFYTIGGGYGSQKGLGIDRLAYWYRAFGLGTPTGIGLPGEASGLIPTPEWKRATFDEPWYLGDTYFTAIGQYSVQVTPIQVVRATAAVANGGKLPRPLLLASEEPSFTEVPATPYALQVAREGMRETVTEAIATRLNFPYISVAAKTGTAQAGTRNQYENSWVEGFFPYENPQYAFVVVLERGPSGAGAQSTTVMQRLFESLHAEGSPYVGVQ